jgi:hypothetical protein
VLLYLFLTENTDMNQHTIDHITDFVTGKTSVLGDNNYTDLALAYLSDKNSSTLREAITANICGYEWITTKLGFDAVDTATGEFKEIKPKLWSKGRADGGGNFSDLTPKRIAAFKEQPSGMISSFFVNNKLAYVIEYKLSDIMQRLEEQVHLKCVVQQNQYARSCTFNFKHYMDSPHLKIHYIDMQLIDETQCLAVWMIAKLKQLTNT